jgi:hypothetical protein
MAMAGCMTPKWRSTAIENSCARLSLVKTYFLVDVRWDSPDKSPAWITQSQKIDVLPEAEYRIVGNHKFRTDRVLEVAAPFPTQEIITIVRKDEKDKSPPCDCAPIPYAVAVMLDVKGEYAGLISLDTHGHFSFLWPPDEDAYCYHFFPSPKSLALPETKGKTKDR